MTLVTVPEAQQRLPELLTAAKAGEGVVIAQDDGWTFQEAAIPPSAPETKRQPTGIPRAGTCKGIIWMSDDFDAPLEEMREYME